MRLSRKSLRLGYVLILGVRTLLEDLFRNRFMTCEISVYAPNLVVKNSNMKYIVHISLDHALINRGICMRKQSEIFKILESCLLPLGLYFECTCVAKKFMWSNSSVFIQRKDLALL